MFNQQEELLWEQQQQKFDLWDSLSKSRGYFFEKRDMVMVEKIAAAQDEVWAEYEQLKQQRHAIVDADRATKSAVTVSEQTEPQPETAASPVIPTPIYPGQYTTWGMHKRTRPAIREKLLLMGVIQVILDVPFAIVPERAKSWREEIVDDALLEDAS